MAPRSATAMTARAPPRPWAVSVVPSIGSTAMSVSGGVPSPIFSPLKSMGALSFSPSPMTTIPSIGTLESTVRMASTAAPSAPSLSPRPIQRLAAMAAASVTRTRSMARLRSGAWRDVTTGLTIVGRRLGPAGPAQSCQRRYLGLVDTKSSVEPSGPLRGTVRAGGAKNSALKLMAACLLAEGCTVLSNVPRISDVDIMAEVLRGHRRPGRAPRQRGCGGRPRPPTASWCRRGPTSSSRRCGPPWSSSVCSWPAAARCGCRCRVATTSVTGRSTST